MIVVGVDGSEESKETLRFALEEARRRRTDLHVVHAFWEWEPIPGKREIELDRSPREREAWLAALVRDVVGEVTDVEIRQSTVDDDPAPALLAAAQGAELMIVGCVGRAASPAFCSARSASSASIHSAQSVLARRSFPRTPDCPW